MSTHDNQMPTPVLISIKICTQCRLRTQKLLMLDQNPTHSQVQMEKLILSDNLWYPRSQVILSCVWGHHAPRLLFFIIAAPDRPWMAQFLCTQQLNFLRDSSLCSTSKLGTKLANEHISTNYEQ